MDQDNRSTEQQEMPKASNDRTKNGEDVKYKSVAEEEISEKRSTQALLNVSRASNDVPTKQPQARIAEHGSRIEQHQGPTKQEVWSERIHVEDRRN